MDNVSFNARKSFGLCKVTNAGIFKGFFETETHWLAQSPLESGC